MILVTSYKIGLTHFLVARCAEGQRLHNDWANAIMRARYTRALDGDVPTPIANVVRTAAAAYWRHRCACWECVVHGC
jgi:hypothetical protein